MDLITALLIFFGMSSPEMTFDQSAYESMISSNQTIVMSICQDPTQLDLMRQIDRRED